MSGPGVYPRACGGTVAAKDLRIGDSGLSPRVRGNHQVLPGMGCPGGSIPARAGEPSTWIGRMAMAKVYPRACGGTSQPLTGPSAAQGLSPRVRGNRSQALVQADLQGSIPARAGEPPTWLGKVSPWTVYPRACGGTSRLRSLGELPRGLSPRVRGNHSGCGPVWSGGGSIPARAGEPYTGIAIYDPPMVYPRACGGTSIRKAVWISRPRGLSPRVRGNPCEWRCAMPRGGSIPARAGEPESPPPSSPPLRVYPRACGGT